MDVTALKTPCYMAQREFFNQGQHQNRPLTKQLDREAKTTVQKARESYGVCSVTDEKGLFQITEVEVHTSNNSVKELTLCDSACSHSRFSKILQ